MKSNSKDKTIKVNKKESKIPLLIILVLFIGFILFVIKPKLPSFSKNSISESISTKKIKADLLDEFKNSYPEEAVSNGNIVEMDMVASKSLLSIVPGVETNVWSYNDQVPGPEIRLTLGDTLKLNFKNDLPQATTIHWHGVRVPNAMDGVPGVTQDAIEPGDTFVYEFTPKDSGTYWFHPHERTAEQVGRGLYGTLIVEDPEDPEFDLDQLVIVDDWRLMEDGQINPVFDSMHDVVHDGRWGNVITVNGDTDASIQVQENSINRLRFANTSNARIYKLSFGRLAATAISVDGMKVGETFDAEGFELPPGSRIDVAIVIPEGADDTSFVINDVFTRNNNKLLTLNVSGFSNRTDIMGGDEGIDHSIDSYLELVKADHFPNWTAANELEPDHEYILDARRATGMGMMGVEWTINGRAFPDYEPITLKHNTLNKIRFTNASSRLHPMHLHGQFFQVISRNGIPVSEIYWRDTVLLHPRETVDIVIVPMDKGVWMNHCHILEHAEAGMMTTVEVI